MICSLRRCRRLVYALVIIFLMSSQLLSAAVSVGTEITPMLSLGLNAGYEYREIRAEIGTHFFLLSYLDSVLTQGVFLDLESITIVHKAVLTAKFTPWKNHAIYGGVGALCYMDREYDHYSVTVGPALQYAWKFPKKSMELSMDLLVPLRMFHDYETDPEDDLTPIAGLVWMLHLLSGPTIGISWTF